MYFDIEIASFILFKSSVIITISDASMADEEPMLPIDIPISALFKTGVSFIPSPTNTNLPCSLFSFNISSTFSTFPEYSDPKQPIRSLLPENQIILVGCCYLGIWV